MSINYGRGGGRHTPYIRHKDRVPGSVNLGNKYTRHSRLRVNHLGVGEGHFHSVERLPRDFSSQNWHGGKGEHWR